MALQAWLWCPSQLCDTYSASHSAVCMDDKHAPNRVTV